MADAGRKNVGDQVQEKITPDSQKSTLDQAKESATGAYDRAAGAVQPGDQKSTTQKAGDTLKSGGGDASGGKGVLEQAQDTVSGAAQSVSDTVSGQKK